MAHMTSPGRSGDHHPSESHSENPRPVSQGFATPLRALDSPTERTQTLHLSEGRRKCAPALGQVAAAPETTNAITPEAHLSPSHP